ncbi:ABC transporter permease [Sagittula stellata]|uniref:ABC sugar transporter, inner membrane subunit n=1 Tax=Sagittula stellata (strain ATCC 700073 / DSM 11524 / E-37) TaxID=388399 RepID=A3JWZ5_SAGS3|nr:ABC transporter permease [Sagittula stellata]EBA10031.1 ABC sugar transporter, inner membrane subunit [Sagittula stellata E-37]
MSETASKGQDYESSLSRATSSVAEFERRKGLVPKIRGALHSTPALVPLIVLVLSIVVFGILLGSKFFSPFALTLILQQVQIVGIVAAAQSLVILTAGIDLSVGAIMVLSSVVMGQFTFRYGIPAPVSILCGLACGTLMGFINGWLVAKVKLPPFIVTLGMWQIVLATNFLYSANETIRAQEIEAQAPLLQFFGTVIALGGARLTYGAIFMLLLFLFLAYMLNQTAWGRHVYAVGDDKESAELSGIEANKVLISVYMASGLICAFAGWALVGRIGSVSPTSGQLANIESITAVVIGGISLFGGRGAVMGSLFGALIVGVFTLGLRLLGADAQWTYLLIGVLIIGAVAVDQWIRKASA